MVKVQNKKQPPAEIKKKRSAYGVLLSLSVILILTAFSYSPTYRAQFTNWDDNRYIAENPVIKDLSSKNIKTMFNGYFEGNYHPLTMISYAINYSQDKLEPRIYHVTNVFLHLLNTILVFWLIYLLVKDIRVATIVSALFGLHTMHVESVAWVSERKDVLYAFFFLLSLISYLYYFNKKNKLFYFVSIALFLLSLLSKGMAVSLVFTLVAIDFYLNRKLSDKKVILEKIPYLILALLFGIIAFKAQDINVTELTNEIHYPFIQRIAFAGYGFINYIGKLIYPYHLAILYPYPVKTPASFSLLYFIFPIIALGLTVAAAYTLKFTKDYFFGTVFFIANLILVLQLISVGIAVMADRYTYISSIGLFFIAGSIYKNTQPKYKSILASAFVVYCMLLVYQTRERCKVWDNSISLWDDQAKKYPDLAIAYGNRGLAKGLAGDHYGAMDDFTKAVEKEPTYASAYDNRGRSKEFLGDQQGALSDYTKAIAADKTFYIPYQSRGRLRVSSGDFKGAIEDLNTAIQLKQNDASLFFDRGMAWVNMNELQKALDDFTKTITLDPLFAMAYTNRGLTKMNLNDKAGALLDYDAAINANPRLGIAYYNRAGLKLSFGNKAGACEDFHFAQTYGYTEAANAIAEFCR